MTHGPYEDLARQVREKRTREARRQRMRQLSRDIRALESQAVDLGVPQAVLARLLDARNVLDLCVAEEGHGTG